MPGYGDLRHHGTIGSKSGVTGLMRALEELHRAFVLLSFRARAERAQISALARLWIGFPGVQSILTALQFSDHTESDANLTP